MMEFVHTNVEQRFHKDSAKMLVKSDLYGILLHSALACFGVYAIGFPGGHLPLSIVAHALGIFKVVSLAMIWWWPMLYVRVRDPLLVATRLVDTIPSLLLTQVVHTERYPLTLLPTQFYLRTLFAWFGAFFGAVSKQPPSKLNFAFTLLHLLGRIALYKVYFKPLVPHYSKMAPAVRWLEARGLGTWTEEGLLWEGSLALDVMMGMLVPCYIMYNKELRMRHQWRHKVGLAGTPQGAIGATWPQYIGPCLVLVTAAAALASDPKLLPYLF